MSTPRTGHRAAPKGDARPTDAPAVLQRPRTFTALLCAYTVDRWADIERAVGSLRQQTHPPDEILLVSDHNAGLLARATAAFPDARCVANEGAQGLSDARNTGVRLARGDVIGFLDDDAVAVPDWVERMLETYEDADVVGVSGWVRPAWQAPRPAWFPDEFLWVVGCSYAGLPTTRTVVRNPIGANMSFRRDVFAAVGGFDTGIGRLGQDAAGCEETEFSIRAGQVKPGARIVLEPTALCDHVVRPDRVTRRYFRRRCAAEGRSKALVSALTGSRAALATERAYVRQTLPRGVARGLGDALGGDLGGGARAWAIIEGTTLTAVNYLLMTWRLGRRRAADGRRPSRIAKATDVSHSPVSLIFRVDDLNIRLKESVGSGRWTDAALAAAGMVQATDDVLSRTTSPLVGAAARARSRNDLAGRSTAVALEAVARLARIPDRSPWKAAHRVGRWREGLAELSQETAALDLLARDAEPDEGRARRAAGVLRELESVPSGVRQAVARIPSCFRAFDQHPDDVSRLIGQFAARWPDRSRPVIVVAIRTSGSYLAPYAVAVLRRVGFSDVTMISARPDQRPLAADARKLRAAARKGALALVMDDPPTSGGAVAGVCRGLLRFGIGTTDVVLALALFDDAPALPATLSAYESVLLPWAEWSIHRRLGREQVTRDLAQALAPATVELIGEESLPDGPARTHTKKMYRIAVTPDGGDSEVKTVLAAGTGLGYFGEHDVVVASALKGRVPSVIGAGNGVIYTEWPSEARELLPSSSEVVEYAAARHDALPVAEDLTARLRGSQPVWEVASNHLARAYGQFWPVARLAFVDRLTCRLLRTASPSVPDGDMRPSTWLVTPDSNRVVKTGFADRSFSNYDLVCLDDRFDVVGAAVHTGDPTYSRDLRAAYEVQTDRPISPERWLIYELVHLWDLERLGAATPGTVSHRKSQALRRYLAEVLLPHVEAGAQGPVVALDVDGVLETDVLGFKAPTPTSVMCLRALHAHGYRTVLVTGRCLEDVIELSDQFGLAGGAAEYGSVVYNRHSSSTTPLVADDVLASLAELRGRLQPEASVRVDVRHRYSVRASTVDHRQRLRTFEPPPSTVPADLRAIFGEEQTDFVSSGIDKVDGARALVRELGDQTPVLAVGDTTADVGVLAWTPVSVVPRHADAPAKAAATRIAPRPYQAGLEDAIGGLVGHRPGSCARCAPPQLSAETRTMLQLLRVREGSRLQALLRTVPLLR